MDPRCKRRHHDWSDQGTCRRAGCPATRPAPQPTKTFSTAGGGADPVLTQLTNQAGLIQSPIERLKALRSPPVNQSPTTAKSENKDDDDDTQPGEDLIPYGVSLALVSGTIFASSFIASKLGKTPNEPVDEHREAATKAVEKWARLKLPRGPALGPTGKMITALAIMGGTLVITSPKKEKQATPPKLTLVPPAATIAPDAVTPSPSDPGGSTAPPVDIRPTTPAPTTDAIETIANQDLFV